MIGRGRVDRSTQRYAFAALLAAALFGSSISVSKLLGAGVAPTLMAALLYCGSGIGLALTWRLSGRHRLEGRPRGRDWGWFLSAVVAGGILGSSMLLYGLRGSPAGSAALLLNLESVLTIGIAVLAFRETIGRRVALGAAVMLVGAILLSFDPNAAFGLSPSSMLIVGACLMWAIDNNLMRRVSGSNAVFMAMIKGLVTGSFNLVLALSIGAQLPGPGTIAAAMLVGFLGFGVSLALFIVAMRHLGIARASTHLSAAPFFGGAVAILLLGEPPTARFVCAFVLMAIATWLVLSEHREHAKPLD